MDKFCPLKSDQPVLSVERLSSVMHHTGPAVPTRHFLPLAATMWLTSVGLLLVDRVLHLPLWLQLTIAGGGGVLMGHFINRLGYHMHIRGANYAFWWNQRMTGTKTEAVLDFIGKEVELTRNSVTQE